MSIPSDKATSRRDKRRGELRELLGQREFRLLYIGQTSSIIGDAIVPVALAFAVLELTESASALGLVLAARVVPTVLLLLLGGVIADRMSRRSLMVLCDAACFLSQLAQGVMLLTGTASLPSMIVLQLIAGSAGAFFHPAATGLLPEVVKPAQLQRANGLMGLSENTAYTIGPAIAGVLVVAFSPGAALIFDAATFAVSALALFLIRLAPGADKPKAGTEDEKSSSIFQDLKLGWEEFRSRTWLWTMVAWAASFHLLVLPAWQVFGPAVARDDLGGASAWAIISACTGLGSILGGVIALRMRPRFIMRASFIPLGLYGLQLLALALVAPVPVIAVCAVISNIGLSMFNVFSLTAMQQNVPIGSMSRVSSYEWLGSIGLLPVGQALVGPAGGLSSATSVLVVGAVWMFLTPALLFVVRDARNLEAVHESHGADEEEGEIKPSASVTSTP
ncbi:MULTISPECIES: MFS transporter [Streptomyces]|uniref:MFS transporter n=1 Tax=Streptomyces venezuelae TaxID=54571 RepID=A0A5P2BLJ8_STRVZ|nr:MULTISPECIES: MFS transporter [Streptomyces]NEA01339.1 MFS transporter [Streptomyces sp. SID10116]MYY87410.1 MFS transporter [Streptomyces sp. SID335]MYZ17024.1 MFS transporter [Streptomyces sp. SID337]NDZ89631.1 MFS transporter [Streptomyces sp. SID10115]NEB45482.1 MFS transporter [Streptomyces sp. SID339]